MIGTHMLVLHELKKQNKLPEKWRPLYEEFTSPVEPPEPEVPSPWIISEDGRQLEYKPSGDEYIKDQSTGKQVLLTQLSIKDFGLDTQAVTFNGKTYTSSGSNRLYASFGVRDCYAKFVINYYYSSSNVSGVTSSLQCQALMATQETEESYIGYFKIGSESQVIGWSPKGKAPFFVQAYPNPPFEVYHSSKDIYASTVTLKAGEYKLAADNIQGDFSIPSDLVMNWSEWGYNDENYTCSLSMPEKANSFDFSKDIKSIQVQSLGRTGGTVSLYDPYSGATGAESSVGSGWVNLDTSNGVGTQAQFNWSSKGTISGTGTLFRYRIFFNEDSQIYSYKGTLAFHLYGSSTFTKNCVTNVYVVNSAGEKVLTLTEGKAYYYANVDINPSTQLPVGGGILVETTYTAACTNSYAYSTIGIEQILIPKYSSNSYAIAIESMGSNYINITIGRNYRLGNTVPGYFNIVYDETGHYIESYSLNPKYEVSE